MAKSLDDLVGKLFSTDDGSLACDAINKLTKLANKGDGQAKRALADYVRKGSIGHMREHACSCLAEVVSEQDAEFAAVFRKGLSNRELRYWSILGYLNSAGRLACKELIKIATSKRIPLNDRAQSIKCLAVFSKQPFDRNLPSDPGYWKKEDLRLSEVMAWAKAGYREGREYFEPSRHPALDKPKTSFEKTVSRFDKKLAKKRSEKQDLAAPSHWLALAATPDIKQITARWKLPSIYLDFLTRFSPIQVTIVTRKYYNHFQIFGAGELIEAQEGYSFDPVKQRPLADWPSHLVVIANHGGDPIVLNLSKSTGRDAPVDTAEHGAGEWDFRRAADSFTTFLETLALTAK